MHGAPRGITRAQGESTNASSQGRACAWPLRVAQGLGPPARWGR